jgi:hypothetical protein
MHGNGSAGNAPISLPNCWPATRTGGLSAARFTAPHASGSTRGPAGVAIMSFDRAPVMSSNSEAPIAAMRGGGRESNPSTRGIAEEPTDDGRDSASELRDEREQRAGLD